MTVKYTYWVVSLHNCVIVILFYFLQILPLTTNIRLAYKDGQDDEQCFILNLALFICTFLKEHGRLIEGKVNQK